MSTKQKTAALLYLAAISTLVGALYCVYKILMLANQPVLDVWGCAYYMFGAGFLLLISKLAGNRADTIVTSR